MKYSLFFLIFAISANNIVYTYPSNKVNYQHTNPSCVFCQDVVEIISDEVHYANKSVNQIINAVESICNISGPIVKPECDHILKDISEVLNLITKGFNSTKICQMIHLCNYTICSIKEINKCRFCNFLTSKVRRAISLGNSTFNDLLSLIDDICRMSHTPVVSQECDFFITEIKNIEHWIFSGKNNTQICDKLHFCNTTQIFN